MHALTYRCPACGTTVDVTEEMLGETIVCPNEECKQPFDLDVPHGEMVRSYSRPDDEPADAEHKIAETALSDERTLKVTHPAMFRRDPFWFSGYVALAAMGLYGSLRFWLEDGNSALSMVSFAVALVALSMLFMWWLTKIYTTLSVTTKRTVLRTGIISKRTSEVRHNDVRNLQIHQGIFERIFGVGDLAISSAAQADLEIQVLGIPQPESVAKLVRQMQES